ncbi:UNVERIFIED_ORG: iron-regulated ABC transporter permease protein SufD [Idiomarina abyssalis]|uniref:Fe-S cluster assembly protein SufD n=1 Tax=Idiomarina TaxID=135575 RepID=UPI000D7179CB|nr:MULTISPECIES: Fe-S cluster assembly protein SufD [Idiomarina]PWW40421.1 iron-regulated ABC transporter permease protein SufD [Idiomarina loihiensis]TDO51064.1 iron-regulated ABC transporter permease protein SufD [Idiomarina sp. 017G]TDP50112.1 iron-regulated ABC transporter permease protein SufD [Idiomarina loihiensis]TDS24536.1 iron-regulated ABC transporter permease protein SufD [Idiomarina sp. H2]HAS23197.1 Fe-S cluster assembly protein SufD [Idiomarina loihiensis]|tara:strand:- start:32315 stop:33565 length:1251 start_codon:yes stop_codon:yes gene_type:complete
MSQWLNHVLERASTVDDWLSPVRAQALDTLKQQQWPTRRTEAWRYTSLHPVADLELKSGTGNATAEAPVIEGLNSLDLVFVDGQLSTDISKLKLPEGITISELSAPSEPAEAIFAQVKPSRHLFGLVNDVLAQQGVVIDIAAGAKVEQPIRIVNFASAGIESHQRTLVRVGENAQATIIEHGSGSGNSLNTVFAEYDIAEKARLEHYRFALHEGEAIHIGGSHFKLHDHARLNSTLIGYGSQLTRLDVDIEHAGEHAFAKFNNVYLLAPRQHFDLHSTIEHASPNGTTEENARGIIGDRAKAVFNGRIHIHRHAQKTLAELNNRNLLLTRGAQINTKPELEIYADDVQCAHGATVAEIDEEALYYMLTRGIDRQQALVMLNFGFVQEMVFQMPNKALADWLQPILKTRFESMMEKQ